MAPDPRDPAALAAFVRAHPRVVLATRTADGHPEAALLTAAALDDGTLVVDSVQDARKVVNLRGDPRVAVVLGLDGDVCVQVEGVARVAQGAERLRLGAAYEAQLPGSRALADGYAVVAVTPRWVRVYDASVSPAVVTEAGWGGAAPTP